MKRISGVAIICLLACTGATWAAEAAVYTIHANVRVGLTFPESERIRTVESLTPGGELNPVPLQGADGTVSFTLTPPMMPQGTAILVINRPPGADLSDRTPPRIVAIAVDGHPVEPVETLLLPFSPKEITLRLNDLSGIRRSGLHVSSNGEAVARRNLILSRAGRGRDWTVTYTRPEGLELRHVRVVAEDSSPFRNQTVFLLTVEQGLSILADEQYSGGRAVHFTTETAFVAMRLTLPAGEYELEALAHAPDSGSNSWWIEIDGNRQADAVHIPEVDLGICSRTVGIDPELLPRFTVTADGEHVLALTLRESPGPVLDRVRILREGEEVAAYEAEDMLPRFPRP